MPDAATSPDLATAHGAHWEKDAPDLVGEELGDHARIWRDYDRIGKLDDKERIGNWNRGLDNLALFAGLFSAVTTAFIIQLQNDTRPDYAELTFRVLNATAAGQPFVQEPFTIDDSVRTINCLWIASLMLSLTAALIAIMGKDWIGMYASRPVCNLRQWAEIRTFRLAAVERWYMATVIASAPVLLHVSLVLFSAGLVLFVSPDRVSQRLALGLSLAGGALYLVTMLSGILFSASPFKSPATEALRGGIAAILTLARDTPWYKVFDAAHQWRRNLAIRWQDISFSVQLLPIYIISLDQTHRRPRGIRFRASAIKRLVFSHLRSIYSQLAGHLCSLSIRDFYRGIPSYARALRLYVHETLLTTRWTNVRTAPTPALLAQSISLLNDTSLTPDTLRTTLVALGDMAIGSTVAPLISSDLTARLTAELRRNWRKADLTELSRFILADQNISADSPLIGYFDAVERFERADDDPTLQSEVLLFAYSKLKSSRRIEYSDIVRHCPDIPVQPRAMQYLIPLQKDPYAVILLASRYWHHIIVDISFDLESELRSFRSRYREDYEEGLKARFNGQSGLVEMLVDLLADAPAEARHMICRLIIRVLFEESPSTKHVALLAAFGSEHDTIIAAAWPDRLWSPAAIEMLADAIPLRYAPPKEITDSQQLTADRRDFEMRLARTMIYLLSPLNPPLYLNLAGRCTSILHAELCRRLDTEGRLKLIRLILKTGFLFRGSSFFWRTFQSRARASERDILNILTTIARDLRRLLGKLDTWSSGTELFYLFAFAVADDRSGRTVEWDLGEYLREASNRIANRVDDPGADVAMRRLVAALQALQPFCMAQDDLRAAWEGIDVPANSAATDPYWDCDIGALFTLGEEPRAAEEPDSSPTAVMMPWNDKGEEMSMGDFALLCLDASMR